MALNKGKPGREGYKALFPHTAIHAVGTFVVVLIFAPSFWWLGLVDFLIHSVVDRTKGVLTYQKGWQPSQTIFWWAFGVDQEFHNVTHIAYIALIYASVSGMLG
ncbi:MAG: DUF3307 domain-containing protein [Alphaproteobacteria bacterium]|nr:DUF3307 domain-containing protein [Alphaproteobacteria bacterium]